MSSGDWEAQLHPSQLLYQLWVTYTTQGDAQLFREYLARFIEVYQDFLDVDFTHLTSTGFMAEGPHLSELPDGLLQTIDRQLMLCCDAYRHSHVNEYIRYAMDLAKALVIICRNFDNIALVESCSYVKHLLNMATFVLERVTQKTFEKETEKSSGLLQFLHLTLHLLEVLYDPYCVWRRQLSSFSNDTLVELPDEWWSLDKSRRHYRPALLHDEVIPFFYDILMKRECFTSAALTHDVQLRLFHVFGAIISGSQVNALKAICPATLRVLVDVLGKPFPEDSKPHNNNVGDPGDNFAYVPPPDPPPIDQSSTNHTPEVSDDSANQTEPVTSQTNETPESPDEQTNENNRHILSANERADNILTLKELILKCFVRMIHVIHCCSPDKRQVEVGTILEDYYHLLLEFAKNSASSHSMKLQLAMISAVQDMLNCPDRGALQVIFIAEGTCETFIKLLHATQLRDEEAQALGVSVIRVMSCLMCGSPTAKERFKVRNGYSRLAAALKSLGPPSKPLVTALLDLVVEDNYETGRLFTVQNAKVALILLQWLPELTTLDDSFSSTVNDLTPVPDQTPTDPFDQSASRRGSCDTSHDLQTWLGKQLLLLCSSGTHNRMQCCNEGLVQGIITLLRQPDTLHKKTLGYLVRLLEMLGMLSVTAEELKMLIGLLRGQALDPHIKMQLMHGFSVMARRDGLQGALHYFDFQEPTAGIKFGGDRKWQGAGFSFHCWLCLEPKEWSDLERRQIYSFTNSSGCGLEAFLTAHNVLVIAVGVKREYHTVAVAEHPISDRHWHCLDIVHQSTKGLFSSSHTLTVYIDGRQRLITQLKFPPPLTEPFTCCQIGCVSRLQGQETSPDTVTSPTDSKFRFGFSGKSKNQAKTDSAIITVPIGKVDGLYGPARSFPGLLGCVCVFQEGLLPPQVSALYHLGANCLNPFSTEDSALADLPSKLVLHYNAKACQEKRCIDLSFNCNHGTLLGQQCITWDIKDVINSIGGVPVLFPLLETIEKNPSVPLNPMPLDAVMRDRTTENPTSPDEEWVVVKRSSYDDSELEKNPLAGFLTLLRNMVQGHPVNQDYLVKTNSMAVLGMLLQKVDSTLIDVHVLMALQLLVETVAPSSQTLHQHIYHHLLFDFRIWSRSEFPVRIATRKGHLTKTVRGHIQYLSTIIKDDRKHFRKKYGVQYLLDIIRTYYNNSSTEGELQEDDNRTIRASLFGLIKFYVCKEITADELRYILSFIIAVENENLISEALDMMLALLEAPGKKDQIYLLMFETNTAENLYMLLTVQRYSPLLKEKVLKVFSLLLRSTSVYEKNKSKLRIQESEMYSGLVELMRGGQMSLSMTKYMFEQVLASATEGGYNAALSIIQLLYHSDIDTKLEATRKLLEAVFKMPDAPKLFAKQLSWQDILTRLFIVKGIASDEQRGRLMTSASLEGPDLNVTSDSQEEEEEGIPTWQKVSLFIQEDADAAESGEDLGDPGEGGMFRKVHSDALSLSQSFTQGFSPCLPRSTSSDRKLGSSRSSSLSAEDISTPTTELGKTFTNSLDSISTDASSLLPGNHIPSPGASPSHNGSESGRESGDGLDINTSMQSMGIILPPSNNPAETSEKEKTEELCQHLLIILFTLMWKGVEGSDAEAWKQRGQVLACISHASETHDLLKPEVDLTRRLIEMMLQGSIMDLKETGQTSQVVNANALELLKIIYYFLCVNEKSSAESRYTERIIEDLMTLLDLMTVFEEHHEWRDMEQLGLTLLLEFSAQPHRELYSRAAEGLCRLVSQRPVERSQEASFMMGMLDKILTKTVSENLDQYSFLFPVMKALMSKCGDLLNMETYLPSLVPILSSPSLFEDFKTYLLSTEWRSFMDRQVVPTMNQYEAMRLDDLKVKVKGFIGDCHEAMMIDVHKRMRQRGESKIKFQENIVMGFKQRAKKENQRALNVSTQLRNQHASVLRQWRATKLFFTGEHGAWHNGATEELHWKLSNQENFSRMRPKLVPNHNFDPHTEASRLRDNQGVEEPEENTLPSLEISKEVMVSEDIGDDRLGDEEWDVISSAKNTEELMGKEKLVLSEDCELVTVMDCPIRGRLEVTNTHIYFFDCSTNRDEGSGEDFKLSLSQLREIHFRRYNLRRSALEVFLVDQTNYFLNFPAKVRNKVYSKIVSLRPPNLFYYGSRSPAELLKDSKLTEKWVNREISNFDYLMHLNTIAGRTYNDLSQYPVFPWVLADYTSPVLDLEDPKSYRDLSKPIGVINPKNEKEVKDKYDHFEDPMKIVSKFHFGTHYSNPATVMHYLVRLEPFTTLHIQLQSGKFDVADRQFHSIHKTWQGLLDNPNDVKELIPEFFYLPEFLVNHNKFDLGRLQVTGEEISDVALPTWAESPEDFIDKHRQALESEYVSEHLHQWIDLIFGYKQKGKAAEEALNVFYYCTYEGAVDLDAIPDAKQRVAVEGMIKNFGQTPCQLLKEAHPKRLSFQEATEKLTKYDKTQNILWFPHNLKSYYVEVSATADPLVYVNVPRSQSRSIIQHGLPYSMIGISQSGVLGVHKWLPYDKSITNYFTFERDPGTSYHARNRKYLAGPFAPNLQVKTKLFVVSHDAKFIYSGGHWDNSLRVYQVAKNKTVACIKRHTDIVTCLSLDYRGSYLMTGSRDMTCMIWPINIQKSEQSISQKPSQILYGHHSEITCVAISVELDLAVSASKDHSVILHTVHRGHYMRTLRPPIIPGHDLLVEQLDISDVGHVVLYCSHLPTDRSVGTSADKKHSLHLYSVNGKWLATERLRHTLGHMIVVDDHLILGMSSGDLIIKKLFSLHTITTLPLIVPINCLSVTSANSHLLVGLQDGKLIIVGITRKPEVK